MKKSLSCIVLLTLAINAAYAAGNYEEYVISGKSVHIGGQLPMKNNELLYKGQVGGSLTVEEGRAAAQLAAENIINQLKEAAGSLDRIQGCVKLNVFINAAPDFTDHKLISGAASEAIIAALGDKGRHARTTVGVSTLPLEAPVEIDAICTLTTNAP